MALNFPANPADGEVYENFVWDEAIGVWQVQTLFELNQLQDVTTPSPNEGDLLYYNGTQWVNASKEEADVSDKNLNALFWMYA
jgi:hypothetical protein